MESQNKEVTYSKQIMENVFLFYHSYTEYIENMMTLPNKPQDYIINPSKEVKDKLNGYITSIKDKFELLKNLEHFKKDYNIHYKEKEDAIDWTFGQNGIEKLLPIAIFIFVKKCMLEQPIKLHKLRAPFGKICKHYSLDSINQLFNSNEGNSIMIWKNITLVLILIYPNKNITTEEKNAIKFEQTNRIIKLSKGIILNDTENDIPKEIIFNTQFVRPYLKSKVLLESFITILNEKVDLKNKDILKKQIEKEIDNFLNKDTIYFVESFPQYGVTLADGSVIINAPEDDQFENAACCLMTLFHEMTHVLSMKIINKNAFRITVEETQDIGRTILQLFVGKLNECHKEGCDFILNLNNYTLSVIDFNKAFHSIEEKYENSNSSKNKNMKTYNLYKSANQRLSCVMSC